MSLVAILGMPASGLQGFIAAIARVARDITALAAAAEVIARRTLFWAYVPGASEDGM